LGLLGFGFALVSKRLDPGSSTLARDDTVDSLGVVVFRLDTRPNPVLLIRVNLCKLRAAEVCSAEATELPVWERPPVSVANRLCHP
jgi:tRNA (Thr-GGU) A37 N-methylase